MADRGRSSAKTPDHNRGYSNASSYASECDIGSDAESPGAGRIGSSVHKRMRRFGDLLRGGDGDRKSHLLLLVSQRKARQKYLNSLLKRRESRELTVEDGEAKTLKLGNYLEKADESKLTESTIQRESLGMSDSSATIFSEVQLTEEEKEEMKNVSNALRILKGKLEEYKDLTYMFPIEVRMDQLTYSAPVSENSNKIQTVYNSSLVYKVVKYFKGLGKEKPPQENGTKAILENISLSLKPGKMYLVLGAPGSGKTTLLKAIAGRLSVKKGEKISGSVSYNGKTFEDKTTFHIDNAIAFIDQLDRHEPRLTVDETFEFAFQSKRGGTHFDVSESQGTKEILEIARKADAERLLINMTLVSLGLDHVRDTFVGDDVVRGVSGGQRRRVTVGEMLMDASPIMCGDEISNGLDASSCYEIIQILSHLSKDTKKTRVISLLQPSPETVSLFDEVILLAEGNLLFAGPISKVEDYFAALGYKAPRHVDVADFLQLLTTADAEKLYEPSPAMAETRSTPYTAAELAELFRNSALGERIKEQLQAPFQYVWASARDKVEQHDGADHLDDRMLQNRYANSFHRSVWLNLKRNITVWTRNRRVLIANAAKNIIMGVSVGGVFWQTDDVVSILGVLFQGMLFIMLGAMTSAPGFVDERIIFYKQADANFFSAYPFILAKAMSKLPQTAMDCFAFGTILYFMVGLTLTVHNFFIFMAIIFIFNVTMNELLFVFSTLSKTKASVQVISACLVFFFILFSGFIIAPNVIPDYYSWIYWYNPMAWAYRSLLVNEYRSSEYTDEEGDYILSFVGFVDSQGKPFDKEWISYSFIYMISHIVICLLASAIGLINVRISGESGASEDGADNSEISTGETPEVTLTFKPVTVTFEDISYEVKASTSNEVLSLLKNVNGAFKSGRMCALMGSSGAGKTTLMDVIAMRKTTGTIQGEVRLNGFLQEPVAFRRCSGYVEQFDVQTPQLTVRETVLFSARLRLDGKKVKTDEEKNIFCDQVLRTLELTPLADCLVGSDEEGGLSFEQKKRLSIAVELAASPSILFLDEPTTGLDARSALLVIKLLRKIANQGRTICATIHQPSSTVFDLFDDLLLLKKGGEVVFFGELGDQSKYLIDYFERQGADPIDIGDNPANWMLREIQPNKNEKDLGEEYINCPEFAALKLKLAEVKENPTPALEITFSTRFAAPAEARQKLMNKRLQTIYWRSPTYNLARLLVCTIIAFILGSIFLTNRNPLDFTESDMRAWLSVTFLSFIIIGILSITSVLPVMLTIRDVFYRHRAAGMLDNISLGWALGTAEKWFIVISSFFFCLVFIGVSGLTVGILKRAIRFWGIFTFNLAIYSYFGQAFMCLVPSMTTAQILASVFIGLNNFFSGLIVRPQFMTGFFEITYWITPGHYVYEGLVLAQFNNDNRTVFAVNNSEFYTDLGCRVADIYPCNGTVDEYITVFFGGRFNKENELQDILVLALFLVVARVMTFFALKYFNFSAN